MRNKWEESLEFSLIIGGTDAQRLIMDGFRCSGWIGLARIPFNKLTGDVLHGSERFPDIVAASRSLSPSGVESFRL